MDEGHDIVLGELECEDDMMILCHVTATLCEEQILPREEVLSEREMESDEDSDSVEDDTYQVSWNGIIVSGELEWMRMI
jgi:hypothetical protein